MSPCPKFKNQRGVVLVVALVMLVVLTLFVVSAIRSGNINLRIAGNMQVAQELDSAAEVALDNAVAKIKITEDISLLKSADVSSVVSVAGINYSVTVTKPTCLISVPVPSSELKATDPNDIPCFESVDRDRLFNPDGSPTSFPSACNDQQIVLQADILDSSSGAKTSHVQGLQLRVPAQTQCKS